MKKIILILSILFLFSLSKIVYSEQINYTTQLMPGLPGDTPSTFGRLPGNALSLGEFFVLNGTTITGVAVNLKKVSGPIDNIQIWIVNTTSFDEMFVPLQGQITTFAGSGLSTSAYTRVQVNFTSPIIGLTNYGYYGIIINRSGGMDNTNYYKMSTNVSTVNNPDVYNCPSGIGTAIYPCGAKLEFVAGTSLWANSQSEDLDFWIYSNVNLNTSIIQNYTNPLVPEYNKEVNLTVEFDSIGAISFVNFTLYHPNGSIMLNQLNGTFTKTNSLWNWSSYSILIDDPATWLFKYDWLDNESASGTGYNYFNLSDNIKPVINITFPSNNSNYVYSSINLSFSYYDDKTKSYNMKCWYWQDMTGNNISIDSCNNISIDFALGNHNISLWANDSTGNTANYSYVNFSVSADTTPPAIAINEPIGTKTSSTVSYNTTEIDNVGISYCYYNVTNAGQTIVNIANLGVTPNTAGTLPDTFSTGSTYYFRIACNDTSNNWNQASSAFTVTISIPPSSGGGGSGGSTLEPIGSDCTTNEECASGICDLTNTDPEKNGLCVTTLCGNGFKDPGEELATCQTDVNIIARLSGSNSFLMGLFIFFLVLIVLIVLLTGKNKGKQRRRYLKEKIREYKDMRT